MNDFNILIHLFLYFSLIKKYFKEGGNGILLVPSALAYGSCDYRSIPGGSVLIFEVNLISVN